MPSRLSDVALAHDTRCSDALNLAVLADAPVLAPAEMLAGCIGRQAADSAEPVLLRRAVAADHPEAGKDLAQG